MNKPTSVEEVIASLSVFASSGADLTTEEILTIDKPLRDATSKINRLITQAEQRMVKEFGKAYSVSDSAGLKAWILIREQELTKELGDSNK